MLKFAPILAALLIGFGLVTCVKHELDVGLRQLGDSLVLNETILIPANLVTKVVEEREFTVPFPGYVLTAVKSTDISSGDNGAEAVVSGGGPGTETVKLRFKSQRFYGVHHRVELYAMPKPKN